MNLLKDFFRILLNVFKYLVGFLGTKRLWRFYRDSLSSNLGNFKEELQLRLQKVVRNICFAIFNILLIFLAITIAAFGLVQYLNLKLDNPFIGYFYVSGGLVMLVLLVNMFRK